SRRGSNAPGTACCASNCLLWAALKPPWNCAATACEPPSAPPMRNRLRHWTSSARPWRRRWQQPASLPGRSWCNMADDSGDLRRAVALAYRNGDMAPRVVAKGQGLLADEIIARAREHDVFVHESRELLALLMQVDMDRDIPPALYRAVAELLAWLYRLDAVS